MTTSDWVLSILTGALVLVTAYYAVQTRGTVNEMKAARSAQILPRLVPTLAKLPGGQVFLRIINAGTGPAFNVDVNLFLHPNGEPIRYVVPVMSPGEYQDFQAPGNQPGSTEVRLAAIAAVHETLRLTGECFDALRVRQMVDEAVDLGHFTDVYLEGAWVMPPDHLKEIAKNITVIGTGIEAVGKQLYQARREERTEDS